MPLKPNIPIFGLKHKAAEKKGQLIQRKIIFVNFYAFYVFDFGYNKDDEFAQSFKRLLESFC